MTHAALAAALEDLGNRLGNGDVGRDVIASVANELGDLAAAVGRASAPPASAPAPAPKAKAKKHT